MLHEDVQRAIRPLRFIFWGGVLCVIDITFSSASNGHGFRFDLANDAFGMLLVMIGVFALGAIEIKDSYASAMTFVKVISVLALIDAVWWHVMIPHVPVALVVVQLLLAVASLVAIVVFCIAMQWFCETAQLEEVVGSWRTTRLLFVIIYLLPLGLFYIASIIALVLGESFNIQLGPAGLLLLPVFLVPLIHFFVSTSRMARAAEAMNVGD
jgi:hypothetical protein